MWKGIMTSGVSSNENQSQWDAAQVQARSKEQAIICERSDNSDKLWTHGDGEHVE